MSAKIIDGNFVSSQLRKQMKQRIEGKITPGLTVVLVGENPASQVYVRNKVKACESVGIESRVIKMPKNVDEISLLEKLRGLNDDNRVDGILVQLPLPQHIDEQKILETIAPEKDVDGFHQINVGALVTGYGKCFPCTPYGVTKLLDHYQIPLEGKHAVVVGRSNIVGKPMSLMLLERGATVTICTSKTRDLVNFTRQADIVVMAVGRPNMLTGEMISPGAVVIDVGINRMQDGTLKGDVDFDSVSEVAGFITPVPGGVGPMTITMLLENTIKSAEVAKDNR